MTNGNQQTTSPDQQQAGMGPAQGVPPGANPADATGAGGGNIGTGNVPQPGETEFSQATPYPRAATQQER